jgi:SAM-dependent methyltransferase
VSTRSTSCRFCAAPLSLVLADLGSSPLANSYLTAEALAGAEKRYPLTVYVCERCWLAQLPEAASPEEIFAADYAYFSSYSASWVEHARRYCEAMIERFGFGADSQVIEVASNDGYLLRHFVTRGVPVLGVEPAANCAEAARAIGVPTEVRFFGLEAARDLAARGFAADLLLGNNVLAHVPELNDFVAGLAHLLKPTGVLTLEFPHLVRLVAENQFDTIYHEHFSYFSLASVERVLAAHGLELFDVEELPTHGGSLRLYGQRRGEGDQPVGERVLDLRRREREAGVETRAYYEAFAERVRETKRKLLTFLIGAKRAGKSIAAYGAAAKGNTLLNYCGVGTDFVGYVVDANPHKQGRWLPGSRIPIHAPAKIFETRPDYVLILPWNLEAEITEQMRAVREWGGRFVVAIPETKELP